jgi:bifunctional DNA-binding transcriptional regulator/antitoxin component of YhaV-PrlF toxin-antitoxin module
MEKTKVVIAQPRSRSLRTTIPASIARTLGIEEGTELGWELQARENRFVLEVRVLAASDRNPDKDAAQKRKR